MEENNPIIRIGNSLRELNRAFFNATRKDAELCGVTPIQFLALRLLKHYPLIGLGELSELMHIGASTASGVVDRLVQAGLIRRERTEKDRRAVVLRLSQAGEDLLMQANDRIMKRLSPLMELPAPDVEHLLRIHEIMIDILRKAGEEKQ